MTALDGWVTPAPWGNALRDALRDSALSDRFTWSVPQTGPYTYSMAIQEEYRALLTELARYMRRLSQELNTETANFTQYKDIFSALMRHYDTGIYTLNYDDVVLRACPGLFTGFAAGEFEPRLIGLRTEWGFAYHLHGSVHYSFVSTPADHRIVWQDDLNGAFTDALTWPDRAESRKLLVPTTLIAGGFKLDQLLADPFHTVYAAFNRHVHEADAILIIGYGFGDAHVNRALRNRYFRREAPPPTVVIDKTDRTKGPTRWRQDLWAAELKQALHAAFGQMSRFEDVLEGCHFEEYPDRPVAIWHQGFIEAAPFVDAIIQRLSA